MPPPPLHPLYSLHAYYSFRQAPLDLAGVEAGGDVADDGARNVVDDQGLPTRCDEDDALIREVDALLVHGPHNTWRRLSQATYVETNFQCMHYGDWPSEQQINE